jgi:hypothetical protein
MPSPVLCAERQRHTALDYLPRALVVAIWHFDQRAEPLVGSDGTP